MSFQGRDSSRHNINSQKPQETPTPPPQDKTSVLRDEGSGSHSRVKVPDRSYIDPVKIWRERLLIGRNEKDGSVSLLTDGGPGRKVGLEIQEYLERSGKEISKVTLPGGTTGYCMVHWDTPETINYDEVKSIDVLIKRGNGELPEIYFHSLVTDKNERVMFDTPAEFVRNISMWEISGREMNDKALDALKLKGRSFVIDRTTPIGKRISQEIEKKVGGPVSLEDEYRRLTLGSRNFRPIHLKTQSKEGEQGEYWIKEGTFQLHVIKGKKLLVLTDILDGPDPDKELELAPIDDDL